MLAATQLRAWVCTAVVVPTAVVYFLAAAATQEANEEPWASLLLRSFRDRRGAGCVGLSRIQRSGYARSAGWRRPAPGCSPSWTGLEERERRALSEHLHDGALQYVLAARFDLDDARAGDPAAFDRLEQALAESTRLLRSTVAELHPAVLARAGLPRRCAISRRRPSAPAVAVRRRRRRRLARRERTAADPLLYRTAGELLNNVVKHAGALGDSRSASRFGRHG